MNYQIARNGQQVGSYSEGQIIDMLASGQLAPNDLCWTEGMAEWQAIASIPTLNVRPAATSVVNPYAAPRADVTRSYAGGGAVQLASQGQRFAAAILDVLAAIPAFIPIAVTAGNAEETAELTSQQEAGVGIAVLIGLALLIYNLYRLSTQGQTIGKQVMKIRIVRVEDNSQAGFVKAVLLRGFVNALIGIVPFYGLIDILFIFREDRRCIHDLLAGTHVVQA